MSNTPYLRPNRLPDVIAAIQSMAMNERSSQSWKQWAEIISGDESKERHWRIILDDHPELFRRSPTNADHYALVWRRALPRRYSRLEGRMLSQVEFESLPADKTKWISRPPVPEAQIETLVDIAITLHERQQEQRRDWRWWITLVSNLVAAVIGAFVGAWSASG